MKVVGIVAEYNPFHKGHKYQLDYARNVLKADYIVVAMSGSFTQRGSIACFDKYTRAKAALMNGADLVLELPAIFATASAREFASAGLALLNSTGVVDTLLFGAETDDINGFKENVLKAMEIEASNEFNTYINNEVTKGTPYAQARSEYLKDHMNVEFISSSNNILGFEYIRYILSNGLNIEPQCLERKGNSYNDMTLGKELSSASSIRKALEKGEEILNHIPENCIELFNSDSFLWEDDISSILHYRLLNEEDFSEYMDCSKELSDRIVKLRNEFVSYSQFAELLKTKNLSLTRINRALCHILLGIKAKDFEQAKENGYVNSIRILGFSKKGSELLKEMKSKSSLPIITGPTDELSYYETKASDLLRIILTDKTKKSYPNEYTRKFDLKNI